MDVVDEDTRLIGVRLRQIRKSRDKSLRVVADLTGGVVSASTLSRIENGLRVLDRRSEIVAIAKVLQIAPSELTKQPEPAPANGDTDSAENAVRLALIAVDHNQPGGQVTAVEVLRARARAILDARRRCECLAEAITALPDLIRDLHTSIAAGRDVAELLELAVLLHTQGTNLYLRVTRAPLDLRSQAASLAQRAARELDTPTAMGIATAGSVSVMLATGAFDLAQAVLDSVTVPTSTSEGMQLDGMLALSRSLVAAADSRPADADAPLAHAAELAARTGQGNAYWMGFGPINVDLWRLAGALELGDHERAVTIAEGITHPEQHPNRSRQAAYWIDYGRALARLRGRQNDAVAALHRAEALSPLHLYRNPLVPDVLAKLLVRCSGRDAVGRELRRMAYRAGLPV